MSDALGLSKLDGPETSVTNDGGEIPAEPKKLPVMNPPPQREPRPVTNLGKVFGQFAELQQQIAEQVLSLEDSVQHQRQDIATALAQLPELRERVEWLTASFYEQRKEDESVRERLNRHEAAIAALTEASRSMQAMQGQWQAAIDEMVASLLKAKEMLGAHDAGTTSPRY